MIVELWSKDFQKQMETLDPQVRALLFNQDEVTPSSIMQVSIECDLMNLRIIS